jgi:hypothetical protein
VSSCPPVRKGLGTVGEGRGRGEKLRSENLSRIDGVEAVRCRCFVEGEGEGEGGGGSR